MLLRHAIGATLRRIRLDRSLTLRTVADEARISMPYLSEIERGRKEASSELLTAICGALKVPLSQVLTDAGRELARADRVDVVTSAANIDVATKVVIPPVVSMAVA